MGSLAGLEAPGQALGDHVGHGLNGDHGIDACRGWEDGCVRHIQVAHLQPCKALSAQKVLHKKPVRKCGRTRGPVREGLASWHGPDTVG